MEEGEISVAILLSQYFGTLLRRIPSNIPTRPALEVCKEDQFQKRPRLLARSQYA
jgi:hypothetical protein